MYNRKITKTVNVGEVSVGGGFPVSVQSMTNTDTRDAAATIRQILDLEEEGCEIIRVAVPDMAAAAVLANIKKAIHIPLVADIHFDWRIALVALDAGVDKLRINPGNIGSRDRVEAVVNKARERNIPIRIGVNGGSLEKRLADHSESGLAEAMVESALGHINILESLEFDDIIISMKASGVPETLRAYEILSEKVSYPLHVGITETGAPYAGSIKSAAGIGAILSRGIGDTVRISLTGSPLEEVRCARELMKAMKLRCFGPEIISCPTCGRTQINLTELAGKVENAVRNIKKPIKIAIMGCAVNGPGEAQAADVGITGGNGRGAVYRNGKVVRSVAEDELFAELMREIDLLCNDQDEPGKQHLKD